MSNIFWNIHLIVSRLQRDEIQPIWSVPVKFHENRTKIQETTALLRMCIEIFFNKAFLPDFARYGHSALTKLIDARKISFLFYFDRIYHISKSFSAILTFWKIRPLGGAEVARPPPVPLGGASFASTKGPIFQNFRIAWKLSDMISSIKISKKPLFSRIDELGQCWVAMTSKIWEKKPCWKNFEQRLPLEGWARPRRRKTSALKSTQLKWRQWSPFQNRVLSSPPPVISAREMVLTRRARTL